ncbi:hypothetical protein DdX_07126 [Ditylenchus destructor]|uniref:Uncharacterized protein n=1 Tax=Ditylenchus destructor TaxID=166010 RepID=A0AAD4N571_9BILA|nr:hypothetical protein DdX_07126 [Ditylenchus destructor]
MQNMRQRSASFNALDQTHMQKLMTELIRNLVSYLVIIILKSMGAKFATNKYDMKLDTGFKCDYDKDAPVDKRCDCGRSLGRPIIDPNSGRRILAETMIDGPHHFANFMCHKGLHPNIYGPSKGFLSQKSICTAGRFYQSRDLMHHFVTHSKKPNGKYVEHKADRLNPNVNYFICCKRDDQFYWQIYYGTDEHCVAGYGPYPGYNERRYFYNANFCR